MGEGAASKSAIETDAATPHGKVRAQKSMVVVAGAVSRLRSQ